MTLKPKRFSGKTILRPFQEFLHVEASGGILLLIATLAALLWANSSWADSYRHFWEIPLSFGWADHLISKPLHFWINDGLMAVFFFTVGLEIKREVLAGELSSLKQCLMPVLCALGGMVVPALIYTAFNHGLPTLKGWGIPMATDIAFAIGVMTLLGKRIPTSLKVFLIALAIADDLGAVLVIAFFYTGQISWFYLSLGGACLLGMIAMNRAGVRHPLAYGFFGIGGAWIFFLLSGVHATVASVLAALTIPVKIRMNADEFVTQSQRQLSHFKRNEDPSILITRDQQAAIHNLETLTDRAQSPLQHLEDVLHIWVSHAIMPLFALANAGVSFGANIGSLLLESASLGIMCGLFLGKPLGILTFGWLGVKLKLATLPSGVVWRQIAGAGILAGIGFTMSLFIANLAFEDTAFLPIAKLGIFSASILAGVVGTLVLIKVSPRSP